MSHLAQKGQPLGFAELDAGGVVPSTQAPLKAVYENGGGQALVPANIGPSGVIPNSAGSVSGSNMSAGAKQSALQSKVVGKAVQSAEQPSPAATTLVVTTLLGFDVNAGVDPLGTTKGKGCLLEAAGGVEYNTTTNKVGANAQAVASKWGCYDANGDAIVDGTGQEVWAIITATARTIAGVYTLRFYSGEFGSGSEAPYNMAQAFVFQYGSLFDLDDQPTWASDRVGLVDAEGAQIAPGSITDNLIANSGITTRSKLPSALAYEDESNTFTLAQVFQQKVTTAGRIVKVRTLAGGGVMLSTDEHVRVTATGAFTLLAAPPDGTRVSVKRNYAGLAYSIPAGVGDTVDGGAAYALNGPKESVTLTYVAATLDWEAT